MRKILILGMILAVVFFSAASYGGPLQTIANTAWLVSFQGKLEGVQGDTADITFKLYYMAEGFYWESWSEDHIGVDISDNGIFNVILGTLTPLTESDFSTGGTDMEIIVNGTPLTPKQPVTAAPFAIIAKSVRGGRVIARSASTLSTYSPVHATNSGGGYGVYGRTYGGAGGGVYGVNSGTGHGVMGQAGDADKGGVYGINADGYGVLGESTDKSGVYGKTSSNAYGAVVGLNTGTGLGAGVRGISTKGYGVIGVSKDKYSVYGVKLDNSGLDDANPAVYGKNEESTAGDNPGVKGESDAGYGVYGIGAKAGAYFESVNGKGVEIDSGGIGVNSISASGPAVFGRSYGVGIVGIGGNDMPSPYSVANAQVGEQGVRGFSKDSYGVQAISQNNHALYAENVKDGASVHAAVYAKSKYGYGLRVQLDGGGNDAVKINTDSTSVNSEGINVRADAGRAIYAYSTSNHGIVSGTGDDANKYGVYTADRMYAGGGYFTTGGVQITQKGVETGSSDIAEWIGNNKKDAEAGDVVVADPANPGNVRKSSTANDSKVVGIVSTKPGYLGGTDIKRKMGDKTVKLALAGVVPCKVTGTVAIGDLLTTSNTPGHAMKATNPQIGTIVGKALEALPSGKGKIKVLVTLQ